MTNLYLFAQIGGTRVAICTDEIEAVVKLSEISSIPRVPAHVAGLSALRSRVLTVIDTAALVWGRPAKAVPGSYAIITDIAGHSYGMMVDSVSDIAAVPDGKLPLRGQLDPAWKPFAKHMVENEHGPHLLIGLASFINHTQPLAA
ncbi:MAG: chemotaxis protein CheW [Alphaproteobacteria bacterium]|nr:chemotaxis protein CheW [Alphaproteobacteria bacterium]